MTREIWYGIPTANPERAIATLKKWRSAGYKTAVLIDEPTIPSTTEAQGPLLKALGDDIVNQIVVMPRYEGYYRSVQIIREAIREKLGDLPDILVCGGDDMDPDPNRHPQEIAEECFARYPDGYFVMQPVGDDLKGTDKICGSPWFGKEWLRRAYGGNGPFSTRYFQYYGDEELRNVAEAQQVLWQRKDLVQYHHHYIRQDGPKKTDYQAKNENLYFKKDGEVFKSRKERGFPDASALVGLAGQFYGAKTLVTGGSGFIGAHLCQRLKDEGAKLVVSVDRQENPYRGFCAHVSVRHDLTREMTEGWFNDGLDFVFHLAAEMGGIGYIENFKGDIVRNSTRIDLNVLDAAVAGKVGRLLYTSSACVYPGFLQGGSPSVDQVWGVGKYALKEGDAYPADAEDGYGWQKLYSERMMRHWREDFGLDTRIARLHNIFGPYGTYDGGREKAPAAICRKVAQTEPGGEIEVWGDGSQLRSYCYVDDCVEGLLRLMLSDHVEPINIGTEEMVSVNQLIDTVCDVAGKTVTKRYDPSKPKGVHGRNADLTLAREVLGWYPARTLRDGIAITYPWIRDQLQKG